MNLTRKEVSLILDCVQDSIDWDTHDMESNISPESVEGMRDRVARKKELRDKIMTALHDDIIFTVAFCGSPTHI